MITRRSHPNPMHSTMVTLFKGDLLGNPELESLLCEYHQKLQSIDKNFQPSTTGWWKNEEKARVLVEQDSNKRLKGFVIIGYQEFVDADVKSEICEIYSSTGYRGLMSLLNSALNHLSEPWGFQVYESNHRARKVFEFILKKKRLNWTVSPAIEKKSRVLKFRILNQPAAAAKHTPLAL
jgi:hypothetical protein